MTGKKRVKRKDVSGQIGGWWDESRALRKVELGAEAYGVYLRQTAEQARIVLAPDVVPEAVYEVIEGAYVEVKLGVCGPWEAVLTLRDEPLPV
jgi:hypothetical protein